MKTFSSHNNDQQHSELQQWYIIHRWVCINHLVTPMSQLFEFTSAVCQIDLEHGTFKASYTKCHLRLRMPSSNRRQIRRARRSCTQTQIEEQERKLKRRATLSKFSAYQSSSRQVAGNQAGEEADSDVGLVEMEKFKKEREHFEGVCVRRAMSSRRFSSSL